MRVKLTIEDSSERWIVLGEDEARKLQFILNNLFTEAPTLVKESPGTLREPTHDADCDCIDCYTKYVLRRSQ